MPPRPQNTRIAHRNANPLQRHFAGYSPSGEESDAHGSASGPNELDSHFLTDTMSNRILALAATTLLATTASAQFCSDNTYPVRIVDAAGNEVAKAFDPTINENTFLVPTENVFLAFDPNLPTGNYYVHVTDTPIDGMDEVVSENDPLDRIVHVDNNNGVITLSWPFSSNPANNVVGVGLNGVGESLLLNPFRASQYSECNFKVFYGDRWNLANGPNNPWLVQGGMHPTGECAIRSYHSFKVGDGNGSDINGNVFNDLNGNGVADTGEPGLEGWTVKLVDGTTTLSTTTDVNGDYVFENAGAGNFTVELEMQTGFNATTATSHAIETCACGDKAGGDFGVAQATTVCCEARTIGFWRNCHGRALVQQNNLLQLLPALCIVNQTGQYVAPANISEYTHWLRRARSWNMAYMLSAQLVGMHNNVAVGFVSAECVVNDPDLGTMTIELLMQQAVASLCANPFTPPGHPERNAQRLIKNALDRANNNQTWASGSCSTTTTCGTGSQPKSGAKRFGRKNRRGGRRRR